MNAILRAKELVEQAAAEPSQWSANVAEAESLLRSAVAAEPENIDLLTCLGAVLCDRGKYKEASIFLVTAIGLGSTDRHTYFNLGVAKINGGKRDDAMGYFHQTSRLQPSPVTWEAYFDPLGY